MTLPDLTPYSPSVELVARIVGNEVAARHLRMHDVTLHLRLAGVGDRADDRVALADRMPPRLVPVAGGTGCAVVALDRRGVVAQAAVPVPAVSPTEWVPVLTVMTPVVPPSPAFGLLAVDAVDLQVEPARVGASGSGP